MACLQEDPVQWLNVAAQLDLSVVQQVDYLWLNVLCLKTCTEKLLAKKTRHLVFQFWVYRMATAKRLPRATCRQLGFLASPVSHAFFRHAELLQRRRFRSLRRTHSFFKGSAELPPCASAHSVACVGFSLLVKRRWQKEDGVNLRY